MTGAQSFLLFLIVLGGAATMLRLVSRSTPTVPYPVLLAVGGIVIGLAPGLRSCAGVWLTFWGGLRGALSVALALSVAGLPQINREVSVVAYAIVVLSLLVQGGLPLPVAGLLGLRPPPASA
jgi:NhaP-type Na+/H+ or K+/H+ antiporter